MKNKLLFLIFAIACIFFHACNFIQQQKIVGKWSISSIEFPPIGSKNGSIEKIDSLSIEFFNDGSFNVETKTRDDKKLFVAALMSNIIHPNGKYEFNKDGMGLLLDSLTYSIEKITSDSLILKSSNYPFTGATIRCSKLD